MTNPKRRASDKTGMRWFIGILIVIFMGICSVLYASTRDNSEDIRELDSRTAEEIGALDSRMSVQEAILQRVESNTEEIKRLLEQDNRNR